MTFSTIKLSLILFGLAQLLKQAGRFARTDHKAGIELFISFDSFLAVEPRIRPAVDLPHTRWECRADIPQMIADLFASGAVAVA